MYFMCVFCLHVCLCSMCMCGVHEGQKMAPDTLELEWGITHHVGTGNQVLGIEPRSSARASALTEPDILTPTPCFTRVSPAVCVPQASRPQVPQDFPVSTSLHLPTHHRSPGVSDTHHHVQVSGIPGICIKFKSPGLYNKHIYTPTHLLSLFCCDNISLCHLGWPWKPFGTQASFKLMILLSSGLHHQS